MGVLQKNKSKSIVLTKKGKKATKVVNPAVFEPGKKWHESVPASSVKGIDDAIKEARKSEQHFDLVLENLGEKDIELVFEALISARASWRTADTGAVNGGKAKTYGYKVARENHKRLNDLIKMVRDRHQQAKEELAKRK